MSAKTGEKRIEGAECHAQCDAPKRDLLRELVHTDEDRRIVAEEMAAFDAEVRRFKDIQPAMQRTIEWLWSLGYDTTDSGDGVTNVEAGMEHALPFPHVVIVVPSRRRLIAQSRRLRKCLHRRGVLVEPRGRGPVSVQATYDPADGSCIIFLSGVDDAVLFEATRTSAGGGRDE